VESGKAYAVDLLESERVSDLKEPDRKLATELVMGVLRWRGDLDFQIERLSGRKISQFDLEILVILRLGVYQIRFLAKIPKRAATNESVELVKLARKRSAAGLVNAVLRKCQPIVVGPGTRKPASAPAGGATEAGEEMLQGACRSIPGWLFERWVQSFGMDAARSLAWASVQVPLTTVRVSNSAPENVEALQRELAAAGVMTRRGRFASSALVAESGNIRCAEAWCQGQLVAQDEASQIVGSLLAPHAGQAVLDVCAAPGIKTSQIAAALGSGRLIACDFSVRRLNTLKMLLPAMVAAAVRLGMVRLDATRDLPFNNEFDRVLVDAPCSGTGTLARNPEIKWRLRPQDLGRLQDTQTALLKSGLTALGRGGRLVYSTCSLEPEENEQVVEKTLAENHGFHTLGHERLTKEFPHLPPLFDERGYLRTRPDLHHMDGFFAAVITRE
jgi:16S rRNA (cytosine967-C5)-methyltransferase